MNSSASFHPPAWLAIIGGLLTSGLTAATAVAQEPLLPQAVVDLAFDEDSGDAIDRAGAGEQRDDGTLVNGPERVPSPFWGQSGRRAVQFDADRKQFVQLADSLDLDRPDAVTLSLFFLNLHEANDAAARGIVAKRTDAPGRTSTNYGINFVAQRDILQVYVNHGGGFRIATYSVKQTVPAGRRVHLTATFEVGRAPGREANADAKDLRIRLFINGEQAKPAGAVQGNVAANDVWLNDVNVEGLLNDAPLTIGSTNPQIEFTSGLVDRFLLFPRALTPEEAARLFVEVAGENASELAKQDAAPPPLPRPQITAVSLRGVQLGEMTRLTITGQNLDDGPRVVLPVAGLKQTVADGSNSGRLIVDLEVPAGTPPGRYPLRVETARGLSNAVAVALDELPQHPAAESSAEKPAQLPGAFSGTLAGAAQPRLWFAGNAGQRVVADLEARRLGAAFDPVLEIKTERGTPMAIEWSKVFLGGDVRAEVTLPADGLYFVELHDLAYKAPGQNPYRLRVGDIPIVDAFFPPAVLTDTERTVQPIGSGLPPGFLANANMRDFVWRTAALMRLPEGLAPRTAAPALRLSEEAEVIETPLAEGELQAVNARFAEQPHLAVNINGRIAERGEEDRYLLAVTPGQKLTFAVAARSLNSPLDTQLRILGHPQGNVVARSDDQPANRDPRLEYTVPANIEQVQLVVRDIHGHGGPHFLYRVRIVPAGQPDFELAATTPRIELPQTGTAVVELQVTRRNYAGPIRLRVLDDPHVSIAPEQLTAQGESVKALVTLTRTGGEDAAGTRHLRIVGESEGLTPPLRRVASVAPAEGEVALLGHRDFLPAFIARPSPLSLAVTEPPPALFKGVETEIPVTVERSGPAAEQVVRLTLLSTEAERRVDPNDANKGLKPQVRPLPYQTLPPGTVEGMLRIAVPLDVAEPSIALVVQGDLVPHAFVPHPLATAHSAPLRLSVKNAVAVTLDPPSLILTAGQENKLTGTVKRTEGFTGSLDVTLNGLPQGYTAEGVTVPPDQDRFELTVKAPDERQAKDVPNVTLAVTLTGGGPVLPAQPVLLKVTPAAR